LHPDIRSGPSSARDPHARLEEAIGLALAIDLNIDHAEVVALAKPRPATLFGKGVVERFADFVKAHEIEVTIVDTALAPIQQRNLERAWNCKVIDRTGLILEIFGARARTKEGQLQVELAALSFQRSRLVRSWTHLERQRGGFGFLGGPGERQLEMDRRIITSRITRLKLELDHVRKTRALHRAARRRVPYPVVALVGYTNAGKSTLFNRLTRAEVPAGDMLFATLDPTMRRVSLPSGMEVILSDTVGFISDLPHDLVAAFRATLEEVTGADLILHVRDIAHPDSDAQRQDVEAILGDLGLGERLDERAIEVFNKIDLLDAESRQVLENQRARGKGEVLVSALTGEGVSDLLAAIDRHLAKSARTVTLAVALDDGAALAWLYNHGQVLERRDDARHAHLRVDLDPADLARFQHRQAEPVGENS
jgi:GTP-binding protein HflX